MHCNDRHRTRRWMIFFILSLIFGSVNWMTLTVWLRTLSLESSPKTIVLTEKNGLEITGRVKNPRNDSIYRYIDTTAVWPTEAIIDRIVTQPTQLVHKPITERQDRMETLDRLKNVLQINNSVEVLRKAGARSNAIPLWSDIEHLYGRTFPRMVGLERCQSYQNTIPKSNRWIAPAGLFHSGTNLLGSLMKSSCEGIVFQGQVPYGKHNPVVAAYDANYRIPTKEGYKSVANLSQVLPVVMARHPLDWMKSVCHQKFAISWMNKTTDKLPCPSLDTSISVSFFQQTEYDHLLALWIQWNKDYLDLDMPRLLVRLEDLVYAPRETLKGICDCVGGSFRYDPQTMELRKGGTHHQDSNGDNFLIQAWGRHSRATINHTLSSSPRNQQLSREILVQSLDAQRLLEAFHYEVF